MEHISKILIILATASLFFRRGIIKPYTFQPFEVLILLAAGITIVSMILYGLTQERREKLAIWLKIFPLLLIFLLLGSINGYINYGIDSTIIHATLVDLFFIITQLLAFLLIIYYGLDTNFRKNLLLAFLVPIIFIPFVFSYQLADRFTFLESNNYFWGLHQNYVIFGSLCFITFISIAIRFIYEKIKLVKFSYWLLGTLTLSIIIWTGARSTWLAIVLALITIIFYLGQRIAVNKTKYWTISLCFALFTALISFLILPPHAQVAAMIRVFPQVTNYDTRPAVIKQISLGKALSSITEHPAFSIPYQNRGSQIPQALSLFSKNMWGLGTQYHRSSKAIIEHPKIGAERYMITGVHNSFFQVGISGGIGALIIYIWLLSQLIITSWRVKIKNREWLLLIAINIGLFAVTFFHGILRDLPWVWIIMSLTFSLPIFNNIKQSQLGKPFSYSSLVNKNNPQAY
ncbi:MAG: O-antigen ligase family protein [Patescibacteria group bacterium]